MRVCKTKLTTSTGSVSLKCFEGSTNTTYCLNPCLDTNIIFKRCLDKGTISIIYIQTILVLVYFFLGVVMEHKRSKDSDDVYMRIN